jgi:hypothetical protein
MTTNQERIETKMDANLREIILDIIEMKDGWEERTASLEATEVNLEKMEPNPGEKEAAA